MVKYQIGEIVRSNKQKTKEERMTPLKNMTIEQFLRLRVANNDSLKKVKNRVIQLIEGMQNKFLSGLNDGRKLADIVKELQSDEIELEECRENVQRLEQKAGKFENVLKDIDDLTGGQEEFVPASLPTKRKPKEVIFSAIPVASLINFLKLDKLYHHQRMLLWLANIVGDNWFDVPRHELSLRSSLDLKTNALRGMVGHFCGGYRGNPRYYEYRAPTKDEKQKRYYNPGIRRVYRINKDGWLEVERLMKLIQSEGNTNKAKLADEKAVAPLRNKPSQRSKVKRQTFREKALNVVAMAFGKTEFTKNMLLKELKKAKVKVGYDLSVFLVQEVSRKKTLLKRKLARDQKKKADPKATVAYWFSQKGCTENITD